MSINPETLTLLLKRRGLNQAALADKARVSVKTIGRALRGSSPNAATVKKIADALDVELKSLTGPPEEADAGRNFNKMIFHADSSVFDNFKKVEYRFGVSQDLILALAPVAFTLLVKMAIAWRHEGLAEFEKKLNSLQDSERPFVLGDVGHRQDLLLMAMSELRSLQARLKNDRHAWEDFANVDICESADIFGIFLVEQLKKYAVDWEEAGHDNSFRDLKYPANWIPIYELASAAEGEPPVGEAGPSKEGSDA